MVNNNKTTTSKSFKYKTKIIGITPNNENRLNAEVVVPLKYLSNFWRYLDFQLINCEIELHLVWWRNCVTTEISRTFNAVPNTNPVRLYINRVTSETKSATCQINNAKLYVSVVTLSINDNINFLGKI